MTALALALVLAPVPKKLVILSWDGGADWIVDRLLEEGRLPNVTKLKANGASAESVIPAYPSKTAVGHAALFTGKWGNENSVVNNEVFAGPSLLDSRRGFDARVLTAEPFWVTAANAGKRVVALSAATSFPPSAFGKSLKPGAFFKEFSGFESELYPRKLHRNEELKPNFEIKVGEATFTVKLSDRDRKAGLDTVHIVDPTGKSHPIEARGGSEKTDAWVGPFVVSKGPDQGLTYFRLWSLKPDGQMELYQRRTNAIKGTETPEANLEYAKAYGAFHDDPFGMYGSSELGPTCYQGGDGEAEKRLLEMIRQDCEFADRGFRYAWKTWNPEVLFHYTPMSDSGGHQFIGGISGKKNHHAKQLWETLAQIFELQDQWLGKMMETVDDNTIIALVADHGMDACDRYLHVNKPLEEAGLLTYDAEGKIDLAKSKAFVPAWSDFFLVVNTTNYQGGIVPPSEEDAVINQAVRALSKAEVDGQPAFEALLRAKDHPALGIGGPNAGDLYFEPAPGLYPTGKRAETLTTDMGPIGIGMHGFLPTRRSMGAIFYAGGASLKKQNLGTMRQIDVLPWLARHLEIDFPPR